MYIKYSVRLDCCLCLLVSQTNQAIANYANHTHDCWMITCAAIQKSAAKMRFA